MIHNFNLNEGPFESIKNHHKDVEMRTYDERRKVLKNSDYIIFKKVGFSEYLLVKILALNVYKNFFELYANYDECRIGYSKDEIADPNDMLEYYSQEFIDKNGALAIEIKVIDNDDNFKFLSADFNNNNASIFLDGVERNVPYSELENIINNL